MKRTEIGIHDQGDDRPLRTHGCKPHSGPEISVFGIRVNIKARPLPPQCCHQPPHPWSSKMRRLKALVLGLSLTLGGTGISTHAAETVDASSMKHMVQIQQIRNATAKIDYAGKTFLLDPFLAKKGTYPGFEGTFNSQLRNPLIELPMAAEDIVEGVDAVIVSHTHLDHWDGGDHQFIPKAIPLFVQDEADAKLIRGQGYTDVRILGENTVFDGVQLTRTGGQHGTDEMYSKKPLAEALGRAMGIVFQAQGAKTLYVAGDTIWHSDVDQTLAKFKPDVIILNTGDAR